MNRLYLIRHGENLANLTLEFSHRKVDYSLTPKGMLQARQTAEFFQQKAIDGIYSSPLKRALETAQIIAEPLALPVVPLEAFREVNVGDLEGQKPTLALWARHNAIVDGWRSGHPEIGFPNGEDYPTLMARTRAGLEQILSGKNGCSFIIVGHGGIFGFIFHDLCAGMDWSVIKGGIPNCSITEIDAGIIRGELIMHLISYASASHLSGEAAQLVSGGPDAANPLPLE
jgi:broad specificity phosphatase PhoE